MTPWVARHRRRSSWCLWGPHTLLLYILHICSLSHCECNYMCNQLWSNHIYPINLLFCHYIPLFSLLSLFLSLSLLFSFCCEKWYTFSCDTALMQRNVFPFISFNIFVLCCFIPLGSTGHLVCDTAFGMQHTKFLGGMCNPAIFRWYLGDVWVT